MRSLVVGVHCYPDDVSNGWIMIHNHTVSRVYSSGYFENIQTSHDTLNIIYQKSGFLEKCW